MRDEKDLFSQDITLNDVSDGEDAPAAEGAVLVGDPMGRRGSTPAAAAPRHNEQSTPRRYATYAPAVRREDPAAPERDYRHSSLVFRVSVYPWPQTYNYYRRFVMDAQRYFRVRGTPCPREEYFSYIPQYAQMSRGQLLWYFWFRERARAGEYMDDVSFPYILLYVYEIINLPDLLPPAEGASQIAGLWLACRGRHPELDKYLSEWMCDYCLVHGVPLPEVLTPLLPEIIRRASFKEFYIAALEGVEAGGKLPASALLACGSDYSYRNSKYYPDNREMYDTHIPAAIQFALARSGLLPDPSEMRHARAERDAFCGSLCAQTVKRRIRLEYCSLSRSYEIRAAVTAAVKLAENGLRRHLKIKSRLSVTGAPAGVAEAVGMYFGETFAAEGRIRCREAEDAAYERLYDAPSRGIDFGDARALEVSSWANTELLVPEEFTASQPESSAPAAPAVQSPACGMSAPAGDAGEVPWPVLWAVLAGKSLEDACREMPGRVSPASAEARINEYFSESLGDVVLEQRDGKWRLIEDYRDDAVRACAAAGIL